MSIVYGYRGVASQMKGDDWWTAAPREPEPIAEDLPKVSAVEIINSRRWPKAARTRRTPSWKGWSRALPETFAFQTSIPTATWRMINRGADPTS